MGIKLRLERLYPRETYCVGKFYVDGYYFSDSLERPWLDNKEDVSCIPTGTYKVEMTFSPKHNRIVPQLIDVPNRTSIQIHAFNFPKESKGCIGLGRNTIKGGISDSRFYCNMIYSLLTEATDIEIEIV